jgi:DNA-binding NarL/FixJ family response regulator
MVFEKSSYNELTPRETVVLSAARDYEPVSEIASSLHVPQSIVCRHLNNIVNKLNQSDQQLAHQLTFNYDIQVGA